MNPLKHFDVRSTVVTSVSEIFEMMLSMELEFVDRVSQSYMYGPRVLASINLIGDAMGIVNLQVGDPLSRDMAAAMHGTEPEDLEDETVFDVIGEVCNMLAGNLKSALSDAGIDCILSTPSLTSGKDYLAESSPMTHQEYFTFYFGEYPILVCTGLKYNPETPNAGGRAPDNDIVSETPTSAVNAFDIQASVAHSVAEVFDTMLSMQIEVNGSEPPDPPEDKKIVGAVSFSGDVTGWVNMRMGDGFSRTVAGCMLGTEPEAIDSDADIQDVVGEVCNMISGALKSDLCDAGMTCTLSPPSFTVGSDFEIECLQLTRYERFGFRWKENIFHVEVGLKPGNG